MSKAVELINMIESANKDVVTRALKWWSNLPPEKQKEFLSKVTAEQVSNSYKDIYGVSATASASEDISKTKKILTAAALTAFLLASNPAHAAGQFRTPSHPYIGLGQEQTTTQQDQQSPDATTLGKRAADVTKRAIDLYGNPHTQQRVNKVSQDVEFIQSVLDTLSGK